MKIPVGIALSPLAWAEQIRKDAGEPCAHTTPPVLLNFPRMRRTGDVLLFLMCAVCITQHETYISHITMRHILRKGVLRSQNQRRAGYLRQISAKVCEVTCRPRHMCQWPGSERAQIPQNSRPDLRRMSRLARLPVSGPWRRGVPFHYCHRNEAQPVIITYYCMADARRVVRPGLPCVFSCRPTGQAGSLSKFDLRHRRFAGRSSVMTAMCALQVSEGAMAAVRKKAWQAPRRSGNNRWCAIGERAS